MVERVRYGADADVTKVDGIPAPAELMQRAQRLANDKHKTHFIGPLEIKNPAFKEPPMLSVLSGALMPTTMEELGEEMNRRYVLTGEYILTDNRDEITPLCGRFIWVTPDRIQGERDRKSEITSPEQIARTCAGEQAEAFQEISCMVCKKVAEIAGGSTDREWAEVRRGCLPAQNLTGTLSADDMARRENIKFQRYICGECFFEDPDLCRFFNKIGLRVR